MFTIDPRKRIRTWAVKGMVYGYPRCCIEEFLYRGQRGLEPPEGPWAGSGFIPCKGHQPEATTDFKKFVDTHITPNRVYDKPFPIDEEGDPGYKWPKASRRKK